MVSYTLTKFGGNRHRDSGDVMVSVCHVISQNHLAEGWSNMSRSSSKVSHNPAKFGVHGHAVSKDMSLVCHVILI